MNTINKISPSFNGKLVVETQQHKADFEKFQDTIASATSKNPNDEFIIGDSDGKISLHTYSDKHQVEHKYILSEDNINTFLNSSKEKIGKIFKQLTKIYDKECKTLDQINKVSEQMEKLGADNELVEEFISVALDKSAREVKNSIDKLSILNNSDICY